MKSGNINRVARLCHGSICGTLAWYRGDSGPTNILWAHPTTTIGYAVTNVRLIGYIFIYFPQKCCNVSGDEFEKLQFFWSRKRCLQFATQLSENSIAPQINNTVEKGSLKLPKFTMTFSMKFISWIVASRGVRFPRGFVSPLQHTAKWSLLISSSGDAADR